MGSPSSTPLSSELTQQAGELPLHWFTEYGGWPHDETLELNIRETSHAGNKVHVTVTCFFTEVVPSSCADINHENTVSGQLELTLDLANGIAYYVHDTDEH